jgi:hypothetical protein
MDMNEIPTYVKNALDNWDNLAFAAYDWYEKLGRIAIGIEPDPNDLNVARLLAFQHDYRNGEPDANTAHLIATYDPDHEIVIQFMVSDRSVRTQRLRTAPGARHPKRVFFFEMLRRLKEEPESLDVEDLPGWVVAAVGKLQPKSDKQ